MQTMSGSLHSLQLLAVAERLFDAELPNCTMCTSTEGAASTLRNATAEVICDLETRPAPACAVQNAPIH